MVKHSSLIVLTLFSFACSSDPNAGDQGTLGTSGASSVGSGGATNAGSKGIGGGALTFGGNPSSAAGSGGAASGEVPPETVEVLRKSSCAGWSAEPEALPAVLELVVDTSLSMDDDTPATKGRSKWEVTREALARAVDSLPASTAVGMLYYPNQRTTESRSARQPSACVNLDAMIDVALLGSSGSDHRATIASSLRATSPNGWTPTHDAYHHALVNGLETARFAGNRYMLLITDGAPTLAQQCIGYMQNRSPAPSPTQPIVEEVAAARERGIRTFVIGSPGSEVSVNGGDARPWMSHAATVGGTAKDGCSNEGPNYCHIDLTQVDDFSAALSDALADVAGQVVSCSYALPTPPAGQELDLSKVNVIFTPGGGQAELIGRTNDANCTEGYRVDGNNEVTLCSETCRQVQADATATIEVLFGCASAPVMIR